MSSAADDAAAVARPERAVYDVRLVNGFEIRHRGAVLVIAPASQRLVAYLALRDRPSPRQQVAETLFIDREPALASGSLRSVIHRLRRSAPDLVATSGERISLSDLTSVDIRVADGIVDRLMHLDSLSLEVLPDCQQFCGELLPGWADDWVLAARERTRQRYLHALDLIAQCHLRSGRPVQAIEASLAAAALEPLRESPRRVLVEAHLLEGNLSEAVREYERFAALLRRELGMAPTHRMTALLIGVEQAHRGHPDDEPPSPNAGGATTT